MSFLNYTYLQWNTVTLLHPEELTYELVKKKFVDLDLIESKNTIRNDNISEIKCDTSFCNYVFQKNQNCKMLSYISIPCNQIDFSNTQ